MMTLIQLKKLMSTSGLTSKAGKEKTEKMKDFYRLEEFALGDSAGNLA